MKRAATSDEVPAIVAAAHGALVVEYQRSDAARAVRDLMQKLFEGGGVLPVLPMRRARWIVAPIISTQHIARRGHRELWPNPLRETRRRNITFAASHNEHTPPRNDPPSTATRG